MISVINLSIPDFKKTRTFQFLYGTYDCFHPQPGHIGDFLTRIWDLDPVLILIIILFKIVKQRNDPVLWIVRSKFVQNDRFITQTIAEYFAELQVNLEIVPEKLKEMIFTKLEK